MKDLSLAFALYNQTITNGFKQLRSDLSALNDAADNLIMRLAADDGAIVPDTAPIEDCDHICSSNCRRVGCNCAHGEWHDES